MRCRPVFYLSFADFECSEHSVGGWIALTCAFVAAMLCVAGFFVVRWWRGGNRIKLPEALEGKSFLSPQDIDQRFFS